MKSGEDRGEAGERRSLFGDSGLAQAYENGLELGEIGRVVAHRRPGGAKASNGEGRNEGETDLNRGTGLIEMAKLRESRAQHKIYIREISVGLDRPPIPSDRLLPTTEVEVREADPGHPDVSVRIAGD
jgi:hypothetical protein